MAKVVAVTKGYFGGVVRELGDTFVIPDALWKDEKKRPSWVKLDPASVFGGKGDHDGDGHVGGSVPKQEVENAEPVTVPADWQNFKAPEKKALAKAISGQNAANVAEADAVISAYVEASAPEPFADAPEPQTIEPQGNGVVEALGGPAPDWIAPQPVTD